MRRLIQSWRYWGYDHLTVATHQEALDRRNWRTLSQVCMITALISLVGLVLFHLFWPSPQRTLLCMGGLAMSVLVAWIAARVSRAQGAPSHGVSVSVQVACTALISACLMYQGTLDAPEHYAVLAIWWLCFFQIVFIFSPRVTMGLALVYLACFWTLTLHVKAAEISLFDIAHSIMAAISGQYISWTSDRLRMKNLVDESQLRRANAALFRSSTTDALTTLKNRRCVFDALALMCESAQSDDGAVACAIIDLDNFKHYNDTYGHPEGDRLLAAFGKRLTALADEYGLTAGRIGGEEFMLIWRVTGDRDEAAMTGAMHAIPRMMPEPWQSERAFSLSVGCCALSGAALSHPDFLYASADRALYHAKNTGRDRVCRLDPTTDRVVTLEWEE